MGLEPTTTGITIRDSNQLSYAHHNKTVQSKKWKVKSFFFKTFYFPLFTVVLARPAGLEPAAAGLAYQLLLSQPLASLWSGLSLHRFRCHTYSLYGTLRYPDDQSCIHTGKPQVSTGLPSALPVKVSPLQCGALKRFIFPKEAPISGSCHYLKAGALSS